MDPSAEVRALFFGEALMDVIIRKGSITIHPGGAPANAAVAVSRHGHRVGLVTTVGLDTFGDTLVDRLHAAGVVCSGVRRSSTRPTSLAVAPAEGDTSEKFIFYRHADLDISPEQIDLVRLGAAPIFAFGSLSLTHDGMRPALVRGIEKVRRLRGLIVFDANYRSVLWSSERSFRESVHRFSDYIDVIKVNSTEARIISDEADPGLAARSLSRQGFGLVLVTLGRSGCLVRGPAASFTQKAVRVAEQSDDVGTGDAFLGAFVAGMLSLPSWGHLSSASVLTDLVLAAQMAGAEAAAVSGAGW